MRIKIECGPPLPSLKAWFIVPPVSTISDLKETLCTDLPGLRDGHTNPDDVSLFLDGFELLDATLIDVVRDGDMITIKSNTTVTGKRKTVDEDQNAPRKRPRHAVTEPAFAKPSSARKAAVQASSKPSAQSIIKRTTSASSLSSDSDSDSESHTSDSDSDSDSSSVSSTSSSASSTSSAPSVQPSSAVSNGVTSKAIQKTKPAAPDAAARTKNDTTQATVYVPPGHGKVTTQSRNQRRRLKKQYERLAAQTEPKNPNDIPLSSRHNGTTVSSTPSKVPTPKPVVPTFMMASLSNKNKRKGFKQAMASTLPRKIIFTEDDETRDEVEAEDVPAETALPFAEAAPADIMAAAPNLFPRLIPPSELQDQGKLPPNIFVTSIDVEDGIHLPRRKNNKKKQNDVYQNGAYEVEKAVLDYGDAEDMVSTQRETRNFTDDGRQDVDVAEHDWSTVDAKWNSLPKLTNASQVQQGFFIGWKALAINPVTFTPEFLLNIGQVTGCEDKLIIQPVYRPGAAEISFGSLPGEEANEELPLEEETFEWPDIFAGDWRIVS